jgi:hypothetical protein
MKLKPKFNTSSFDKVLTKLEKTIKRTNRSKSRNDDKHYECLHDDIEEEMRQDNEPTEREFDINVSVQRVDSDVTTAVQLAPSFHLRSR